MLSTRLVTTVKMVAGAAQTFSYSWIRFEKMNDGLKNNLQISIPQLQYITVDLLNYIFLQINKLLNSNLISFEVLFFLFADIENPFPAGYNVVKGMDLISKLIWWAAWITIDSLNEWKIVLYKNLSFRRKNIINKLYCSKVIQNSGTEKKRK